MEQLSSQVASTVVFRRFSVARYLQDGSFDVSFGRAGTLVTSFRSANRGAINNGRQIVLVTLARDVRSRGWFSSPSFRSLHLMSLRRTLPSSFGGDNPLLLWLTTTLSPEVVPPGWQATRCCGNHALFSVLIARDSPCKWRVANRDPSLQIPFGGMAWCTNALATGGHVGVDPFSHSKDVRKIASAIFSGNALQT